MVIRNHYLLGNFATNLEYPQLPGPNPSKTKSSFLKISFGEQLEKRYDVDTHHTRFGRQHDPRTQGAQHTTAPWLNDVRTCSRVRCVRKYVYGRPASWLAILAARPARARAKFLSPSRWLAMLTNRPAGGPGLAPSFSLCHAGWLC